ncbi:CGNR zinc finger domain-containing protein [Actinomadura rugatobispora]|uniref:CGNR zinc finger domain-containing protein n=1 Tax=Actinomadura rugatobispora TaxID=1994 RepID=UPI0036736365
MEFTFVSGDAALDLAGTVRYRRHERCELLTGPAEAARWTVAAGLLDAPPHAGAADLAAAVALREAIYRAATAVLRGEHPAAADRDAINDAAARPPVTVRLTAEGGVARTGDMAAALAEVARAAVHLLTEPLASAIKECQDPRCTRLYVDHSRRRSRRWCDMRECGNRAKAAAFRERNLAGP